MSNPSSVSDEFVEIAAKAGFDAHSLLPWEKLDELDRADLLVTMRAAIEAIAPRLKAEGLREAAGAKPTIAFQKERYGATVATIADDGAGSILEVMKLPNDRFQLTVHSYNEQRGYGEDMSITLKAEHFAMLGQVPAAARADALSPPPAPETK